MIVRLTFSQHTPVGPHHVASARSQDNGQHFWASSWGGSCCHELQQSSMGSQRKQLMEAPASPTLKPASDVRAKFLSVIGIEKSATAEHSAATPPKARHVSTEWMHPRQQQANRFEETLKYDPEEEALYSPKRRKMDSCTTSEEEKPRKKITFDTTVKVVPIPMRDEYSNRVRSRIWSNAVEIHQNATRNSIEFAAEGWDWREVMEDECMFVDVATGELVHPIHYDGECESQQEE